MLFTYTALEVGVCACVCNSLLVVKLPCETISFTVTEDILSALFVHAYQSVLNRAQGLSAQLMKGYVVFG